MPTIDIDLLKATIYEDFLVAIASVQAGQSSDVAFRDHEQRVRHLRQIIAAAELRTPHLRLVG